MRKGTRRWLLGGGIGSGKSAVRALLEERGIRTIDADSVGHEILEPGSEAYESVVSEWPQVVSTGRIDRARLARIVFNDPAQLRRLETITHPLIFGRIRRLVEGFDGPAVVEIPLLKADLGEGWGRMVVDADDAVRLRRAVARGLAHDDALARMKSQPPRAAWLAAADMVIPNHGSMTQLRRTVDVVASLID
ncbi:MAG: dephospho-CoA kinase [Acidimicrobiia bacterium]